MITIKKYNESFGRILGLSEQLRNHLYNKFAILVPDYKYNTSFKRGSWDGKEPFFNKKYDIFPLGLTNEVISFIKKKERLSDNELLVEYSFEEDNTDFTSFFDNLNLKEPFEVRDYQGEAVKHALKVKNCILKAATSAGKSLIINLITKYIMEQKNEDILIIVPQIQLVNQLYDDFKEYGYITLNGEEPIITDEDPFTPNPKTNVLPIGKSTDKKLLKRRAKTLGLDYDELAESDNLHYSLTSRIVISTWQTLKNKPMEYFNRFKAVIMDEVHNIDGKIIRSVIDSCKNAEYRIGMTGTLKDNDYSLMIYKGYFHNIKTIITPRELIDKGYATDVQIYPIILQHEHKLVYQDVNQELEYLNLNKNRISFILDLLQQLYQQNEHNNTLILFRTVTNGFWQRLEKELQYVDNVFVVHGGKKLEDREEATRIAELHNNTFIIASFATFSTGISIKNIHNIIFAESYSSPIKIAQSIGRGMRKHKNKKRVRIFDLADKFKGHTDPFTGKFVENLNNTFRHHNRRMKMYKDMQLTIKKKMEYNLDTGNLI